ncbi:hypothetical protein NLI96_g8715 [Meripilus lineatus]|uniref:Uncharacterized protein n=1 Tax=Meripilus lineatus TaxID=2056292 RepID=A0AAD5YFY8_9APHY|nr:hypothetical protein NLI96_g8715 [Physisporinus lineatus]
MVETVREFDSYAAASVAACAWVNSGKTKVNTGSLQLYIGKVKSGKGKVVGIGYRTKAGTLKDLVRLDIDEHKGIHFNANKLDNDREKFAAVIRGTRNKPMAQKEELYLQYLKGINNRSPGFIWDWWRTGRAN